MGFMDPGNVVWFEISTAEGQAVQDFYGTLLGWDFAVDPDSSVGGVTYARIMAPGMPFSLFQANQTPERLREFAERGQEQMQEMPGKPVPGSYAWFEVGTTDAQATEDFYGQAFGWRFVFDDSAGGKRYSNVFTGNQWPSGGRYDLGADGVDYLMPDFLITDVPAVTAKATELGATVEFGPDTNPDGLVYARIIDPRGNRFGLFSAPVNGSDA
ncbi:VOC family protein [Streptomyces sp. S186]|uniref:VOC family protein n=1 Tax=Streptomyces sp. S186 TaxID=3434395 RepID=UPI003F66C448